MLQDCSCTAAVNAVALLQPIKAAVVVLHDTTIHTAAAIVALHNTARHTDAAIVMLLDTAIHTVAALWCCMILLDILLQ